MKFPKLFTKKNSKSEVNDNRDIELFLKCSMQLEREIVRCLMNQMPSSVIVNIEYALSLADERNDVIIGKFSSTEVLEKLLRVRQHYHKLKISRLKSE